MAHVAVVTGATGFLGSEVVKQLLDKGYAVRATVRSANNTSRVQHLLRLAEALPGTLSLHEADLMDAESFREAVAGARYIFHVASPFMLQSADPERELVQPAVSGVTNVLRAAAAAGTVSRVIYTASFVACRSTANPEPPVNGSLYTEADWNNSSTLDSEPYFVSKVTAEKKAWELSKQLGVDMVAINPTFIYGPMTTKQHESSTSIKVFKALITGKTGMVPTNACDVRDTARAHILAAETPAASGRYIVTLPEQINPARVVDALRAHFPDVTFADAKDVSGQRIIDASRVQRELGLVLRPARETMADMATAALQLGIWTPGAAEQPGADGPNVLAGSGVKP